MPVYKFRSAEEMNHETWRQPGDPALYRSMAFVWELGRKTRKPSFPPGVRKYSGIEAMSAAQTKMDLSALHSQAAGARGLRLLVLHGSRARGDYRTDSDWDFGFVADSTFDPDAFLARLSETLGTPVDLADLSRGSALLRFKVAAEGVVVFEAEADDFEQFRLEAVQTWCDMEPVLTRAYDAALARLAE